MGAVTPSIVTSAVLAPSVLDPAPEATLKEGAA